MPFTTTTFIGAHVVLLLREGFLFLILVILSPLTRAPEITGVRVRRTRVRIDKQTKKAVSGIEVRPSNPRQEPKKDIPSFSSWESIS
jgi:hypothetical protein